MINGILKDRAAYNIADILFPHEITRKVFHGMREMMPAEVALSVLLRAGGMHRPIYQCFLLWPICAVIDDIAYPLDPEDMSPPRPTVVSIIVRPELTSEQLGNQSLHQKIQWNDDVG